MTTTHDRPLAGADYQSYRYRGPYGWIMIGATSDTDALNEASRSTHGFVTYANLERWNGTEYVPVVAE